MTLDEHVNKFDEILRKMDPTSKEKQIIPSKLNSKKAHDVLDLIIVKITVYH